MQLIIKIEPFSMTQNVYTVDDNGKVVDTTYCNIQDLNNIIFSKGIDNVTFFGNYAYVKKLVENAKKEEIKRYRKNKIIFDIKEIN